MSRLIALVATAVVAVLSSILVDFNITLSESQEHALIGILTAIGTAVTNYLIRRFAK